MSKSMKTLALAAFVALAAAGTLFAQFTPKKIWLLTVVVNAPNAIIYVDNVQLPGNATRVTGGPHNVKVVADGYLAFNGPVVVTRDQTFTVNLQPAQPVGFPLTIRVNVPGAAVFVDGAQVQGVPVVTYGQHTIQVSANGYQDYSTVVNVAGPMALDVMMTPLGYLLTVNANVPNAQVTVNNMRKGAVPYSEYLPPAVYTVRVSARGFVDYVATVSLDRPLSINVPLQPAVLPSTLSFVIPDPFLDPDSRQSDVRIFIDGRLVNPHREMDRIPVAPGRHRIRIASGAFSVQMGDFDVQPGTSYVLELGMEVKVRASRAGRN